MRGLVYLIPQTKAAHAYVVGCLLLDGRWTSTSNKTIETDPKRAAMIVRMLLRVCGWL